MRQQKEKEEQERMEQELVEEKAKKQKEEAMQQQKEKEAAIRQQKEKEDREPMERELAAEKSKEEHKEKLVAVEEAYSNKIKTRTALDRELKRLADLMNAAEGSFDPEVNSKAENAMKEYQTLLQLCDSPKYPSVTELETKIASLEEEIKKMSIGKSRTKATRELYELKQRLKQELNEGASHDPNGKFPFSSTVLV